MTTFHNGARKFWNWAKGGVITDVITFVDFTNSTEWVNLNWKSMNLSYNFLSPVVSSIECLGREKKCTYEKFFLTLGLKVFPLSQSIPPYMDPYHRVVNLRVRKTIFIIIHPYSYPKEKSCHQHWSVTSLLGHIQTRSTGPHEAAPLILQCIYSLEKPSMNPADAFSYMFNLLVPDFACFYFSSSPASILA